MPCGGWCPKGRLAEDGAIPVRYPLTECDKRAYKVRTRLNVADSDATLILVEGKPSGGTLHTIRCAEELGKPHLVVTLGADADARMVARWLAETRCRILNVAGPRESKAPGIHARARRFVEEILTRCAAVRAAKPRA